MRGCDVVWTVRLASGAPVAGWVRFTPSHRRHGGPLAETVLPDPVWVPVVPLEQDDDQAPARGLVAVTLDATDDPAYQPDGWAWEAEAVGVPGAPPPFHFHAPAGALVDLGEVVPVPTPEGDMVTRGPAGVGIQSISAEPGALLITTTDGTTHRVPLPTMPGQTITETEPGVYRVTGPSVAETGPGVYTIGGP